MMRWCWVNFQCRGVLLIWIGVGQGPTALAVRAGGVVWTFLLSSIISLLETTRNRLKYCLKGSLSPKQSTSQPLPPPQYSKPSYVYDGGWSGGAMVLGKLPVPGRPTIWITVGQGPTALAVGAGGGCLDICTLIYPFSPLSPSLWESARYRLKYCLKGPLNPKQPTNQRL